MKNLSFAFSLFFAIAGHAFIVNEVYKSGQEVCLLHQNQISNEYSKWVDVPFDYRHPELERAQIYAYTNKKFDPTLPSILFFAGGPGDSSRNNHFSLPHFNIIYFEQRGISCSRPNRRELFLNPQFYSSLNTARDAERIVKAFGVRKVIAYGHSYGTVPATIFSSLFPDQVQSLLLEGVIYQADSSLWSSKRRTQMLQTIFDALPLPTQNTILELSKSGDVPPSWFSHVGNMILQINDGYNSYPQFLDEILTNKAFDRKAFISGFFIDPKRPEEEFAYGDVTTGMIACQELGMADPQKSLTTVFSNRQLIKNPINLDREINCRPLGLENLQNTPYLASQYPVSIPVVYLLGKDDPATPLDQGLLHYKKVARGKKQLLIMEHGGHKPNLSLLQENWDCQEMNGGCDSIRQNKIQVKIFEVLAGSHFNEPQTLQNLIKEFNSSGLMKWHGAKMPFP